jgi:hypothetical protein
MKVKINKKIAGSMLIISIHMEFEEMIFPKGTIPILNK